MSPAPGAEVGAGAEQSLDLNAAMAAAGGARTDALMEDNTLDEFALPPELTGQGQYGQAQVQVQMQAQQAVSHGRSGGVVAAVEDRAATMPFSGGWGGGVSTS